MAITRIIIEGPDCAGKSTLVKALKNELHWDAKALHHKPGNQFPRYLKEYAENENTIFERAHFSEEVYSDLWSRPPLNRKERLVLDEICKIDTIIIFACPSSGTIKKRYLERNYRQQIKLSELKKARGLFRKRLRKVPHILYASKDCRELLSLVKKIKRMVA
ncbi:hypothetical protein HY501_00425 [Candidatus Woesearchaeota archaeon]|nr:hypothetical protein [Candidatus Woesearchaeota archaeon]